MHSRSGARGTAVRYQREKPTTKGLSSSLSACEREASEQRESPALQREQTMYYLARAACAWPRTYLRRARVSTLPTSKSSVTTDFDLCVCEPSSLQRSPFLSISLIYSHSLPTFPTLHDLILALQTASVSSCLNTLHFTITATKTTTPAPRAFNW